MATALTVAAVLQSYSPAQLSALLPHLTPAERREAERIVLWDECRQAVAAFERGPLLWLSEHTKTENPKWQEQGVGFREPFPRKSYFVPVMDALLSERRVFIPKTREMLTSWEVMGYAAWLMAWRGGVQVIVQADKEPKAFGLVNYVRILLQNSPEWMQQRWGGIVDDAKGHVKLGRGSEIFGVPSGEAQVRFYHPTLVIFDEAAKLPGFKAAYNAANPVAEQIVAISSAAPGEFADQCEAI